MIKALCSMVTEFFKSITSFVRIDKTDPRCTELIQYLLDNKNRVEFVDISAYYIYLSIDGYIYALWITNKWYAYLNRAAIYELRQIHPASKKEMLLPKYDLWEGKMPSRQVAKQFYETFERPHIRTEPMSFIQKPQTERRLDA